MVKSSQRHEGHKGIVALLFLATVFLMSAGCCKKIYPAGETVEDTVTVTKYVRTRDTVLKAPPASTSLSFDLNKLTAHEGTKDTTVLKANEHQQAHLQVSQVGKNIIVKCDCDTVAIEAKLKDTFLKENHAKTVTKTVVQSVKYTPRLVKILAWVGGGCLLLIIGWGVKKIWL